MCLATGRGNSAARRCVNSSGDITINGAMAPFISETFQRSPARKG